MAGNRHGLLLYLLLRFGRRLLQAERQKEGQEPE
jgi:hypothetical protein